MNLRDRVIELRRVRAGDLRPHPRNWRRHPPRQEAALRELLADVGFAALLARPLPEGGLQLIDGHLRAEALPDQLLPVLVLDLSDQETGRLLAGYDTLARFADPDRDALAALVAEAGVAGPALEGLLAELTASPAPAAAAAAAEGPLPESFQVVIECADEAEQRALYERLTGEGLHCRLLTM